MRALAMTTLPALLALGLGGCSLIEPEETLLDRVQRREQALAVLKTEADRTAELEQAHAEAEAIRAQMRDEIAALEVDVARQQQEIAALEAETARADAHAEAQGAAATPDAEARARETRRLEHERRVREYQREIDSLKELLRRSVDGG